MFNYKYDELINPTLEAIKNLGGSATNDEITEELIKILKLTDDEAEDLHKGSTTKLVYRSAWAKTYLKNAGYIENSQRGVWSLTELGIKSNKVDKNVVKKIAKENMASKDNRLEEMDSELIEMSKNDETEVDELDWQTEVVEVIKSITPNQFEKLCQRLLRELGFSNVIVTGKPNDGGIDGKGILKIGGVLSFHVAFQAKRYDGNVGPSIIRDFRGAIMGRADKGLVITTGSFTREAIKEAQRDGATPIDLIDGNDLATKLKELNLGIKTELIESVNVDKNWFESI